MPSLIGSLFVSLTADFAPFQRNMQSAEAITASTTSSIRRNMGLTEKSVSGLQRSMSSGVRPYALISAARTFDTVQQRANLLRGSLFAVTAAFGGLGAALATNVISRYFDTFKGIENRLRDVSAGSADLAANMAGVNAVAERSRASLQAVALLYTRLQRSTPNEAPTNILRRVETINKALQLGGATAQEAASAAIQFSQAIQSNRLGGDELRAVLETPLGNELAKGMGITIGKLRQLSKEGKLTADVLYKALDRISGAIDTRFAKSMSTIDQALTVADNKIVAYAGHLDQTYGITRLVTTAIGAFGNNLETIVPLLGQVGFGLGALFAARGGARLGNYLTTPIRGFKALKAARLEDIRLAGEEVAVAKAFSDKQQAALVAARKASGGDVSGLAPKSVLKEYERNLAAVQKADADHLKLLDEKGRVTTQLGEIYRTTTVKEIKAAQALADQEERVNQARTHRTTVGKIRNVADRQLFTAFGGGDASVIAKTKNAIKDIEKEEIAAQKRVAAEESKLESARGNMVRQNGAAFAAAAQQRAGILVTEKKLVEDINDSERRRGELVSKLTSSRRRIQDTGGAVAASALKEAQDNALGAGRAYERASSSLSIMRKSAGIASLAIGGLTIASRSLFAFLGGPWGVAIIAGATLLEYFGARAAKAAAEEKKFQDILQRRVVKVAAGGGPDSQEAQLQLVVEKQKALNEELEITKAGYANVKTVIGDVANAIPSQASPALLQFKSLFDQFDKGNISLDTFRKLVGELQGLPPDFLDNFNNALDSIKDKVVDSGIAIKDILLDIKAAAAEAAKIAAASRGADEDEGRKSNVKIKRDAAAADRRAYGAAQESLRHQTDLARKRQQLLDAAGDTGDQARNTPAKIAAREQELLDQGYADTREEAKKLATEELNLAEKTRLANKAASSGTKDFENFAHKIAELREQASGAFLSDLDQKVIGVAKSLKDGSALMKQYIDAVNSGDMSKAPKELLEARDALMQIGAAQTWNGIMQQMGRGAQLTKTFADKQSELMFLLSSGKITADQATAAYSNFVASFEQYQWIDSTSKAISGFANDAISDFKNVGDAFKSLAKRLLQIATEELVTKPLEQNVRNFLVSLVGGGNNAGAAPSGFNLLGSLLGGKSGNSASPTLATGVASAATVTTGVVNAIKSGGAAIYRNAIKAVESVGNGGYSALGPLTRTGDRAYGAYQVMGSNIPSWTKEALGKSLTPNQFLASPGAQDSVFDHFFGKSLTKYGNPQDAASVWFSGKPLAKAGGASDILGTTVPGYIKKFNASLDTSSSKLDNFGGHIGKIADDLVTMIGNNGFDYSKLLPQNGFKADPGGFAAMLGIPGGSGGGLAGAGGGFGGLFNSLLGGITDLIGGLFKGGGSLFGSILGGIGSLFGAIFHDGGKVGAGGGRGRMVSASAFVGAPRLHSGLKSDEFTAILQKGERVLTARDDQRSMNVTAGLAARVAMDAGGKKMTVQQHFHMDGAISQKDVASMLNNGFAQAVETSKRSFPDWQIEYGKNGAFA